jgi:hypothetical protein
MPIANPKSKPERTLSEPKISKSEPRQRIRGLLWVHCGVRLDLVGMVVPSLCWYYTYIGENGDTCTMYPAKETTEMLYTKSHKRHKVTILQCWSRPNVKFIRFQFWCTQWAFSPFMSLNSDAQAAHFGHPMKCYFCKGSKTSQTECREMEPNPSKDRAMHEGNNLSFDINLLHMNHLSFHATHFSIGWNLYPSISDAILQRHWKNTQTSQNI